MGGVLNGFRTGWRRRQHRGGAALFEFILGVGLAAILGVGLTLWLQDREDQDRARESGRTVAMLAAAADDYLMSAWPAVTAGIGGGSDILPGTLRAAGLLPDGFQPVDGITKRDLAILVMPAPGGGGLQALAGHIDLPADAVARPSAGLVMGRGRPLMGMVETACPGGIVPPCLIGPMIRTSLAGFAGAFPGRQFRAGALMALTTIRHEDWCRDMIKRLPAAAAPCPDSHRMQTALHMSGFDLTADALGAVSLEADETLALTAALTVTQDMTVAADLVIADGAAIAGDVDVAASIATGDARVLGSMQIGSPGSGDGTLGIDAAAVVAGCAQGGTLTTRGGGDVDQVTMGSSTC